MLAFRDLKKIGISEKLRKYFCPSQLLRHASLRAWLDALVLESFTSFGKGSLLTLLGVVGQKKLKAPSKVRKAILEILLPEHSRIMTHTLWSKNVANQILTAVT